MKHTDIKTIFEDKGLVGGKVTVCGWVRTARNSKNMAFMELNDGTTLNHLQIVIDKALGIDFEDALKLGTAVRVTGTAVASEQNGVEINAEGIDVIGECPAEYPLQ